MEEEDTTPIKPLTVKPVVQKKKEIHYIDSRVKEYKKQLQDETTFKPQINKKSEELSKRREKTGLTDLLYKDAIDRRQKQKTI